MGHFENLWANKNIIPIDQENILPKFKIIV
jgi:hypothetical protein